MKHRHLALAALLALLLWLAPAALRPRAPAPAPYQPFAAAMAETRVGNVEAGIPPQCYTRTGSDSNPCWVCHTGRNGNNEADDWNLQERYAFSAAGRSNHWSNLFRDWRPAIAATSDAQALAWVRSDNYTLLRAALQAQPLPVGVAWTPDLDLALGFDAEGWARDGSGWRAFRYHPFPGGFWPSNGSVDEVFIRLPAPFRSDAAGQPSRAVYRINLALLEAAVGEADTVATTALRRAVEPLDEAVAGLDLDGDGQLATARELRGLPAHYVGGAAGIALDRYGYPAGTEFLHTVRYLDPEAPDFRAQRLKELRYAVKRARLSPADLRRRYAEEAREAEIGGLPHYAGNAFTGQTNGFGWRYLGYIEDQAGRLRLQTREEQLYCMGCHTGLGVTVDGSFSLPRKPPGAAGWGAQRLTGLRDRPQAGQLEPEVLTYLRRVGAGDEFRANTEMRQRYFPEGRLDRARVNAAADLAELLLPSPARALALDKAYMALVREQSFTQGREAPLAPMENVHRELANSDSALRASGRVYRDGRLWLQWE